MKPKILIVGEDDFSKNIPHFVISLDYSKAVANAGGLPLLALDALHPENYVDLADGLFLTDGPDIHCGNYGEVYHNDMPYLSRNREVLEFELCRRFMDAKKPIFGIGRGMHVMNVSLGGTLYREIPDDSAERHSGNNRFMPLNTTEFPKAELTAHSVTISSDSKLHSVLGSELTVNSWHHQSVKELGDGFIASATAQDGLVEAIEHRTLPCFGIQWHPERAACDLDTDIRLFEHFISLCKEGK